MDLIINKTFIKNNRLISKIQYDNKEYDMYFEVEDEYKEYLCDENANAFLIALLPFVVKHNYNVIVKDCISSKLYYQLTTYLLPLLCENFNKNKIIIKCDLTDKIYNGTGVGTSISCGVDSFYTLFKHKNLEDKSKNITHLCFFNAGSNGEYGGESARKLYNERVSHIKSFCKEYNYPLITIDSNMNELIMMNHEKRHTFTTLSCVYVLEKLFKTYYFPSGLGFNNSHINEIDTSYYDILNVHCLSNENITFYCSGLETTRMRKVEFISNFKETYNWLNVCVGKEWKNCTRCHKCLRTITALESINKLENYRSVFDIDYYYKNRNILLSNLIRENRNKLEGQFSKEIIKSYKNNNVKIPLISYILSYRISMTTIKSIIKKIIGRKPVKINDGWTD